MISPELFAQAAPGATQTVNFSVFGLGTAVYTGFHSGRNLSVTAGADIGFRPISHWYPSAEVRGTVPLQGAQADSEKNILAGLKLMHPYGRLHLCGDLLFGRGEIKYPNGAVTPDSRALYVQSTSNVLSPGGGVELEISKPLLLKADFQFQRYPAPVVQSDSFYSKVLSFGVAYRFHSNRPPR
jgi:hypothetical protein